jgi:ribosomal protein S18 acetylase RimI-like enzyme
MTISIRLFQFPTDYDAAIKLWQNVGNGIGLGFSDQPDEIARKNQRDPDLFLVAEEDDRLDGTIIGGFDGRRGMLYHLAIAPNYRRQGLASQLIEEIEFRLRAKGCRKAYLLVKQDNIIASAFYEKRGWDEMTHVRIFGKNL